MLKRHWHSPCYRCGGRGMHGEPNGPAFLTEKEAQDYADNENRQEYMRLWNHQQTVEPCNGEFCRIEED